MRQVGATPHRGAGTALHRGARAFHHRGPSCCGAQAPDAQAQQPWLTGPAAPRQVGSSQTRARTRVSCISRQILNHCATREALPLSPLSSSSGGITTGPSGTLEPPIWGPWLSDAPCGGAQGEEGGRVPAGGVSPGGGGASEQGRVGRTAGPQAGGRRSTPHGEHLAAGRGGLCPARGDGG